MTARIFRPAPNAMQSGDGNSKRWMLINDPATARQIEPLMGYTSSTDTETQIRLYFDTLEEAEAFVAQRVRHPLPRASAARPDGRSAPTVYSSDNFRSDRKTPWTH